MRDFLAGEDLFPEPHEDISQEHQPLASTVGRAFYEVTCPTALGVRCGMTPQALAAVVSSCSMKLQSASPVHLVPEQVLRIDKSGKTNKVYIKRRDLLRRNRLLPRDLRRIDPSLSVVKTSPSINIKDHALLMNVGGVRCARSCRPRGGSVLCEAGAVPCQCIRGLSF